GLQRQMDELFRGLAGDPLRPRRPRSDEPSFDVWDRGETFVLAGELPGVTSEDLNIEVTHDTLTVRGKRKADAPAGYSTHRQERATAEFGRTFTFPAKIDVDKVSATLRDGVLTIELAKQAEERPGQ